MTDDERLQRFGKALDEFTAGLDSARAARVLARALEKVEGALDADIRGARPRSR